MLQTCLAVRTHELNRWIRPSSFVALPQEEHDRLHAAVEVHGVDRGDVDNDRSLTALVAFTVVHFNYSWFTCQADEEIWGGGARALGVGGPLVAGVRDALFLDEVMTDAARHLLDQALTAREKSDLHLAGLLRPGPSDDGREYLGLVHVARLRQPGVEPRAGGPAGIQFVSTTELQQRRGEFGAWSQILIDHHLAL